MSWWQEPLFQGFNLNTVSNGLTLQQNRSGSTALIGSYSHHKSYKFEMYVCIWFSVDDIRKFISRLLKLSQVLQ